MSKHWKNKSTNKTIRLSGLARSIDPQRFTLAQKNSNNQELMFKFMNKNQKKKFLEEIQKEPQVIVNSPETPRTILLEETINK